MPDPLDADRLDAIDHEVLPAERWRYWADFPAEASEWVNVARALAEKVDGGSPDA